MPLRFLRASATLAISLSLFQSAHAQVPHAGPPSFRSRVGRLLRRLSESFVLFLRKELNGYLVLKKGKASKWHGQGTVDSSSMEFADLGKVDSQYLSSRFTVYKLENDPLAGGRRVSILFVDKPDRIFTAWMYLTGDGIYELRGFKDSGITQEQITAMRVSYGKLMLDREHAL